MRIFIRNNIRILHVLKSAHPHFTPGRILPITVHRHTIIRNFCILLINANKDVTPLQNRVCACIDHRCKQMMYKKVEDRLTPTISSDNLQ